MGHLGEEWGVGVGWLACGYQHISLPSRVLTWEKRASLLGHGSPSEPARAVAVTRPGGWKPGGLGLRVATRNTGDYLTPTDWGPLGEHRWRGLEPQPSPGQRLELPGAELQNGAEKQ